MASSLTSTTLTINGTQGITGIKTTLNSSNTEVPTNGAVNSYMASKGLLPRVGGTIYYINSSSTNTYTFYNASGTQVSAPTVGTDCTGWSYFKSGTDIDKYYVYNQNAMFKRDRTGTELNPYIAWTYLSAGNQSFIDNTSYTSGLPSGRTEWSYYGYYGRVYETLDGTYTGTAIGTGKSNTQNMMSLRGGVYIQGSNLKWNGQTQYSETIWNICNLFNKGLYNLNGSPVSNNTGCDDWYIPSNDELGAMKDAIGASTLASMLYSGDLSSTYIRPWSSSAYSLVSSWYWGWAYGSDDGRSTSVRYQGLEGYGLALSRSF